MASGIGGSFKGRGSEIYIYGGTVSAQGGDRRWYRRWQLDNGQDMNGINAAHDIFISGGTVSAAKGQTQLRGHRAVVSMFPPVISR